MTQFSAKRFYSSFSSRQQEETLVYSADFFATDDDVNVNI